MRVVVLFSLVLMGVLSARTWTDVDGRQVEGELVSRNEAEVVLLINEKEFTLPLARLSEADRAFLQQLEEEKKAKAIELRGLRSNISLDVLAPINRSEFFEDSIVREMERLWDDWDAETSKKAILYQAGTHRAAMFVPEDYDGSKAYGVYVHISPGDQAWAPNAEYQQVLSQHHLISISAHDSGNKQNFWLRQCLAVDALFLVKQECNVDLSRCYVGGFSGGGGTGVCVAFKYPEWFSASISMAKDVMLEDFVLKEQFMRYKPAKYYRSFQYHSDAEIRRMAKNHKHRSFAYISGLEDFNYLFSKECVPQWQERGFRAKFFDIPGMKHTVAPASAFEEALQWIESNEAKLGDSSSAE